MYRVYFSRWFGYLVSGSPDYMLCSIMYLAGSSAVYLINRVFFWHEQHCASCLLFDLGLPFRKEPEDATCPTAPHDCDRATATTGPHPVRQLR